MIRENNSSPINVQFDNMHQSRFALKNSGGSFLRHIRLQQSENEIQHAKNQFKFARHDNSYTKFFMVIFYTDKIVKMLHKIIKIVAIVLFSP